MTELAIGIDLGTTNSCVAVYRNKVVEVIANGQGNRTTPSYVAFTPTGRLVGYAAKQQAIKNPKNTIFDIKRLIGRKIKDATITRDLINWPFKVIEENGDPKVQVEFKGNLATFWTEEISAMILTHMKEAAQNYLNVKISKAIITVPAYFSDAQRQATKDAGVIADLEVLRIINEPTAAAIAFGFNQVGMDKTILVFDMGGGTLDVSILNIDDGVIEVKSTSGDTHMGGEDLTHTLVAHFATEFKATHHMDVTNDPKALGKLRKYCEELKLQLSYDVEASVDIDALMDGIDYSLKITRAKFEHLNETFFRRILTPIEDALQGARMTVADIDAVLLVGGSSRLPKIKITLDNLFPGEPSKLNFQVNPDEVVAIGAAIQAANLCSGKGLENDDVVSETEDDQLDASDSNGDSDSDNEGLRNFTLLDVTPLSLGIETRYGQMSVIIPRNTIMPAEKTKTFNTVSDNQSTVCIKVYEGERPLAAENLILGDFRVEGLSPAKAREKEIEVKFSVTADGILNVEAIEKLGNKEFKKIIAKNILRHPTEKIEEMIQRAEQMRLDDEKEISRINSKIALEKYCLILQTLFGNGQVKEFVSEEERYLCMESSRTNLEWLHTNGGASEEELRAKYREIHDSCDPLRRKLYVKGIPCYLQDQHEANQEN